MVARMKQNLMLVGWKIAPMLAGEIEADRYPRTDFFELSRRLDAKILSFDEVEENSDWLINAAKKIGGKQLALAVAGFRHRREFDLVFTSGEDIGIPLAIFLKLAGMHKHHLMIGHRLSPLKKTLLWRFFRLHTHISKVLVYSATQRDAVLSRLRAPRESVVQIPFMADQNFFRPLPEVEEKHQICSVGLEWRDYPSLIKAARKLDCDVKIAAASLWSKHKNETEEQDLPANVEAKSYKYPELRQLYAESKIVVIPLYQNDFQAGITSILEAMAMGKPLILTRTIGQTDTIIDGVTGLYVEPGDAGDLRSKIQYLLDNEDERRRLGQNARQAFEASFTLDHLVERIGELA